MKSYNNILKSKKVKGKKIIPLKKIYGSTRINKDHQYNDNDNDNDNDNNNNDNDNIDKSKSFMDNNDNNDGLGLGWLGLEK